MRTNYDLNEMLDMPNAQESFALIALLTSSNPKITDDKYAESVISQLEELDSGEIFIDFARGHVSSARHSIKLNAAAAKRPLTKREGLFIVEASPAAKALRELSPENLARNHAIHCGCVELNAPCMYNNGPCCCTADLDIGDCPFRQGRLRLDDKFVDKQMAKLHTDRDIVKAEENIRRARVLIKQMEEELNSSTR